MGWVTFAAAQNTLVVVQKNGQCIKFGFEEKPEIQFADTVLTFKSEQTTLTLSCNEIEKMFFEDSATALDPVTAAPKEHFEYVQNRLSLSGLKEGQRVAVYGIDGRLLRSFPADADGTLSFSVDSMEGSVFIVRTNELSVKILKNQ